MNCHAIIIFTRVTTDYFYCDYGYFEIIFEIRGLKIAGRAEDQNHNLGS